MSSRVYRVVQWTTGNVGQRSVIAAAANPELEIVGCYAWGPDKVGRDVGELCGIDPIGVLATNDINALLALKPDCVIYNPKWPDVDHMVRILESGINITATAGFITGHALGADRQRILEACERGKSSIFGSGMNPAWPIFSESFRRASVIGSNRFACSNPSIPPVTTQAILRNQLATDCFPTTRTCRQ
jgi:hypothetical protein